MADIVGGTGSEEPGGKRPAGPRVRINCGRLDMRIARDGTWFYHGTPIGRKEMVRLFSTILERRSDGSFWLASPAEEGIIEVEDAPFLAVEIFVEGSGLDQRLSFRTNVDDRVTLDTEHPLRMAPPEDGAPHDGARAMHDGSRAVHDDSRGGTPYLLVRKGLEAKLARPVYYHLVELGQEERRDGAPVYGVWSAGQFFPLGPLGPG